MSPNVIILNGSGNAGRRSLKEPGTLVCQIDDRVLARNGATVKVPPLAFAFIVAVTAHPGAILCVEELTDLLYGERPSGGPDLPGGALDKLAASARPALAALGFRLENDQGRGRFVRCCLSPSPVTYGDLAADLEHSHGQA